MSISIMKIKKEGSASSEDIAAASAKIFSAARGFLLSPIEESENVKINDVHTTVSSSSLKKFNQLNLLSRVLT